MSEDVFLPQVKVGDKLILTDAYMQPIVATVISRTDKELKVSGVGVKSIRPNTASVIIPYSEEVWIKLNELRRKRDETFEEYMKIARKHAYSK